MKLLSQTEIKQRKDAEIVRDITRLKTTKEALAKSRAELDESNARFEIALANQRRRWIDEESEATKRLESIEKKIKEQELALIPIAEEREKAHNLFIDAEKVLSRADKMEEELEQSTLLLEEKLDAVSDFEEELKQREIKLQIKEEAVEERSKVVENLSKELTVKMTEFYKNNLIKNG